jgi:hypothetical protein
VSWSKNGLEETPLFSNIELLPNPVVSTHLELKSNESIGQFMHSSRPFLLKLLSDAQPSTSTSEIIDQAYLDSAFGSYNEFSRFSRLTDEKAIVVINLIDSARLFQCLELTKVDMIL